MNHIATEFKKYARKKPPAAQQERERQVSHARADFWEYCKLVNPKFFKDDRPHLVSIANTLQALYEGRIRKFTKESPWQIYKHDEISEIFAGG